MLSQTVFYGYKRLPILLYEKTCLHAPSGTVSHRANACPRPLLGRCRNCRIQVLAATPDEPAEHRCTLRCLYPAVRLPNRSFRLCRVVSETVKPGAPPGSKLNTVRGLLQAPAPKAGRKKTPATKPEPKKAQAGRHTNVKFGNMTGPLIPNSEDFLPLAHIQRQLSSWSEAASAPPHFSLLPKLPYSSR
ncbi:hypothetical protein HPB50_012685 [Hyalomma asiaticum]|uniref:Uncharacterized protein n=1 Tax=Hyalomma asiaticum TaxID=266040 RepID=A0ACB7TJH1_HYAAI|nr:hypothetical protein HPB50_012685 [Hyalomma asiaticum]